MDLMMLDTGANITCVKEDLRHMLSNARKSKTNIQIADSEYMRGGTDGDLNMTDTGGADIQERVTTIRNLPNELYSFDNKYFEQDYNLILSHPDFTIQCDQCGKQTAIGEPRMAKRIGDEEINIPVKPNKRNGGFWIEYKAKTPPEEWIGDYNAEQAYCQHVQACYNYNVIEVKYGNQAEPCNLRGVKMGLKPSKQN